MTTRDEYQGQLARDFLALLRAGHADGVTLTLAALADPGPGLVRLSDLMSQDPRPAGPGDPEAGSFCDWCGATSDLGPDVLGLSHGLATRECQDPEACQARRDAHFPADRSRIPGWLRDQLEAADLGGLVRASASQAASELLAELAQRPDDSTVQLSGGWYDALGQWHPWDPPASFAAWSAMPPPAKPDHWSHTIRGGAHTGHLISGQAAKQLAAGTRQEGGDVPQGQQPNPPARKLQDPPRRRGRRRR